ncbi:MAG: Lrp/AsnC family transcriptional regulator [Pseudomonadota bacterium]
MDTLDQKLLALLQVDARCSATTLAKQLGVSRGTVQNRIDRMLDTKVIHRFAAELGVGAADQQISAFTLLRIKTEGEKLVVAKLRKIPGVLEISTLSGENDLVVELRAASLADLDCILNAIRVLPDVVETQSNIRLTTTHTLR